MLGDKGLTSSEASRISNYLKERVKGFDVTVDNFAITTSKTVRDNEVYSLDTNVKNENWERDILLKADLYSLTAWLKEAIKHKDNLIDAENARRFNGNAIEDLVKELKTLPQSPKAPDTSIEVFVKTKLSIKEYADYLHQEAIAAHVGTFIHNFDNIRKQLSDFQPTTFKVISPSETLTVVNEKLYTDQELLEGAERLFKIHREAEKNLNSYRARHKEWVAEENRKYQFALQEWQQENNVLTRHNNAVTQKYATAFEIERTNNLQKLKVLKIEIPHSLQPILTEVLSKLDD